MLVVEVPGFATLELAHLVLDVNGTMTVDGALVPGVAEALAQLTPVLRPVAVTADTLGTASALSASLGIDLHTITAGDEAASKLDLVDELGAASVVAIGNGANDALMLRAAAVGIAVTGAEGAATAALLAADIVALGIVDALGLLVEPRRLVATLRR